MRILSLILLLASLTLAAKVDSLAQLRMERRFDSVRTEMQLLAKENQSLAKELQMVKETATAKAEQSTTYSVATMALCGGLIAVFIGLFAIVAWLFDKKNDRELKAIHNNIQNEILSNIAVDKETLNQHYTQTVKKLSTEEIQAKERITKDFDEKHAAVMKLLSEVDAKQQRMFECRTMMVVARLEANRAFERKDLVAGFQHLHSEIMNINEVCRLLGDTPEGLFWPAVEEIFRRIREAVAPVQAIDKFFINKLVTSLGTLKIQDPARIQPLIDLLESRKTPEKEGKVGV